MIALNTENTILLIKPDGVAKNLVKIIREIVIAEGLTIKKEAEKKLTCQNVVDLYWEVDNVIQRDYFPDLVNFMTSASVHIFLIEGNNAVSRVRKIIGKREPSSGIRGKWAENIIKNVAHGPHTFDDAQKQIKLLFKEVKE